MGQKVHPEAMRVGYIHDWKSNWFSEKNFSDFLIEDVRIRDAAKPGPVAILTPEELNITPPGQSAAGAGRPAAPDLDWARTRSQLKELGAVRFELEDLPGGGSRFSCWLPEGSSTRRVHADGRSEGEAVRLCLDRARQLARR